MKNKELQEIRRMEEDKRKKVEWVYIIIIITFIFLMVLLNGYIWIY